MNSLPQNYRAIVVGANGAIGAALLATLNADPRCAVAIGLSRSSVPRIDFHDENSICAAARELQHVGPFHLIVIATGILHAPEQMPEKRLTELNYDFILHNFKMNAVGPIITLAQFAKLLHKGERSLIGLLSAKVGSIGDNRLGGWYSYRASKAALNMLVKTAAIELARTHPQAVLAALHPGTVESALSEPFKANAARRSPACAADDLLRVLDSLPTDMSGNFFAYDGSQLPW